VCSEGNGARVILSSKIEFVEQGDLSPFRNFQKYFKQVFKPSILIRSAAVLGAFGAFYLAAPALRNATAALVQPKVEEVQLAPANLQYGIDFDLYQQEVYKIKQGDVFGTILQEKGITGTEFQDILAQCIGQFDPTKLRAGKQITFLYDKQTHKATHFIYEPNAYEYVVINLDGSARVVLTKREVVTETVTSSGVLETTFWDALTDNGLTDDLADAMIDVLGFSVDFHRQKIGDRFKVVYERYLVEGKQVGTGKILSALYERDGKEHFAFRVEDQNGRANYYDQEGRPQRRAFLKAPVKFSRISSRFSHSRFHPVLRYSRPHHGTDFAAPHGAQIYAIADGVVEEATRRGGNGNFVKIKHDKTYASQYLHMSGFAKGIKPGKHVSQGEVIGYVGSTGLATGPHVCFRFWKNGQQVDFLKQNLPTPEPIKGKELEQFFIARDSMMQKLNAVPYTPGKA
jgi:murein DD-endopeptidase MepM/ murein hydrolase activator NlpD